MANLSNTKSMELKKAHREMSPFENKVIYNFHPLLYSRFTN
jgi:hypothetical protein